MLSVMVGLGERQYSIEIGSDLLSSSKSYLPFVANRAALIITDDNVAPLYLSQVDSALEQHGCQVFHYVLNAGEQQKHLDSIAAIYQQALSLKLDRQCLFVALGGGVVGDMTGFAAATYLRGVPFIQIPTTLLSQVDSSVGGKTGVNHTLGKNMIGAFYQPKQVIIDIETLQTLPAREYAAGLAEVIKYGLIADLNFLQWLMVNTKAIIEMDDGVLMKIIERSCEIKAEVVAADEREKGIRAHLNFGHTFCHAIENILGYGNWLHGEAVAVGMLMAMNLSVSLGQVPQSAVDALADWLEDVGLPTKLPEQVATSDMIQLMAGDKKVEFGVLRLITLKSLGEAEIRSNISEDLIAKAIDTCR